MFAMTQNRVVHILPLGDSITQGGRNDREEYTYRLPLFRMLKQHKVNFDFVGSLTTGLHPDAKWPNVNGAPMDLHHEGHYGWKTAAVRDHLVEWMKTYTATPDIALIHLGSNDQGEDPEKAIALPLSDIVAILRKANPHIVVLIGHLDFNGGKAKDVIRAAVEAMSERLNSNLSPVITVHHYQGWIEDPKDPQTDTFDWAHPNPRGQEKMAKKWFEAMRPFLKLGV